MFSLRVIVARAWTKNAGLSKVRNSLWLGREGQKVILFGCRRDSQSRKQTVFENVLRSRARGLPQFGARIAAPRKTALAAPGCCSWFRNSDKQRVFCVFGPPGTGALRASDATSFSAAAPENGPFLAFWYSRCRIAQPLFR